jgi:hypothetical protein
MTGKDVKELGANFCDLMPTIEPSAERPAMLKFDNGPEFFLTHTFELEGRGLTAMQKAKFARDCGGFLFPSLALGHLPAVGFGNIVLAFDPTIALYGMKPYKARQGRWPVVTYTTDTWTEIMSDFLGSASRTLFEQLTGNWRVPVYQDGLHMYILGPKVDPEKGPIAAKIVRSTKQLKSTLKRRYRAWPRGAIFEEIVAGFEDTTTPERYPYLETKANGVVSAQGIVACCAPKYLAKRAATYLRRVEAVHDVPVIPIGTDKEGMEAYVSAVRMDYAWAVHDALADFAETRGRTWWVQD